MSERPPHRRRRTCRVDRIATTLVAALLLAVAVERSIAVVAGVALVPFLLALRGTRSREALCLGACFGTAYALLLAHWIPPALAALGSSPASAWAGFALAALWVGPPVFVVVAAVERTLRTKPTSIRVLAIGAGVFSAEWTLGHAWWGVPWGLVGHSQRDALGVAQLALVGGVPAISMLLVSINAAIADALRGRRGAGWIAIAGVAAWLALAVAGLPIAEAARPATAATTSSVWLVVQPDLPRGERWAPELQALNLHRVRNAVTRARATNPGRIDALVLPENLLTSPVDARPDLVATLEDWVDELGIPVLTGLVFAAAPPARDRYRSAAVWIEPGRGITARLDKVRAIPLIESGRPFPGKRWLAAIVGGAASWRKVEEAKPAAAFAGPVPVAPLLCYEALFPALAARRRGRDTTALVNLADAGWLPSVAARRRLGHLARFRAIEQRLPLVRTALGGPSWVVDPFGRVIGPRLGNGTGALRVAVHDSSLPHARERAALLALPLLAFGAVASLRPRGATPRAVPYLGRPLSRPPEPRRASCDVSKTGPY